MNTARGTGGDRGPGRPPFVVIWSACASPCCVGWPWRSLLAWRARRASDMVLLRKGSWDAAIWTSVWRDYPSLPRSFADGEVLLDVGCHTGAVSELGARR